MAASINNLSGYAALFSSLNSINGSADTKFLYGAAAVGRYANKLSEESKPTVLSSLNSLNKTAYGLHDEAKKFNQVNDVFSSRTVVSSDTNAVKATVASGAKIQNATVSVKAVAKSQKNAGTVLESDKATTLTASQNSFKISMNGKEKVVSFNVNQNDSNKTTLTNMADAINKAGAGVTAKVVTDDTKKTSYLSISSANTGTSSKFTIEDVTGSAVESVGAAAVAQQAQNADYKINGIEHTSESNEVALDEGKVKLTLTDVTKDDVTVAVKADKEKLADGIESLAGKINETISYVGSNSGIFNQSKILNNLKSITQGRRSELSDIGINVNQNGQMFVDRDRLEKAIEENPNKVKNLFEGHGGIAEKAAKVSDNMMASDAIASTLSGQSSNYMKGSAATLSVQNQKRGLFIDFLL
jgi:flagellar hook-associated protein 2